MCHIFRNFLVSGTIFKEHLTSSVFRFSLELKFETFLLSRSIEGDIMNVLRSLCKMPPPPPVLTKLELSRQIRVKVISRNLHKNPLIEKSCAVRGDGQTCRSNSRSSQLRERV